MDLKEYLNSKNIHPTDFARRIHIGVSTIYHWMAKTRFPMQLTAEAVERATNGEVTVKELRGGEDARERRTI